MEWKDLKSLLGPIGRRLGSDHTSWSTIAALLHSTAGVVVDKKAMRIRNGVLFLDTHPAVKSEILLRKQELLARFRECGVGAADIK